MALFPMPTPGRLYFKTDDRTRAAYVSRGMTPIRSNAKQTLKNYYDVSVEILEDQTRLQQWALAAAQE